MSRERARDPETPTEREAGGVQPAPVAADRHALPAQLTRNPVLLAAVHSGAGNASLARALGGSLAQGAVVARYEGGEHAEFGGDDGDKMIDVNGAKVRKRNIIAFGDFFTSPETMYKAPKETLEKLNELVDRDREARRPGGSGAVVSNAEWEEATAKLPEKERYMELNKANDPHFAGPGGGSGGPGNRAEWEKLHKQALAQAAQDKSVSEKAQAINMLAAHFLSDAFSAGHLINKKEVMEQAETQFNELDEPGFFYETNSFTDAVARRVLADSGVAAKLADKEMNLPGPSGWEPVTPKAFSQLMHLISDFKSDTFFNLFARLVHDKLNEEGVEVSNKNEIWKLTGDETLAGDSLRIGKEAVALSETNLGIAAKLPNHSPQALCDRVWELVPKPTPKGADFIKKARADLTNPENTEAIDRVVALSIKEIDVAISELEKEGYMRNREPDPPIAGPVDNGADGGIQDAGESLPGGVPEPADAGVY